jgi:hypothetical protein
MHAITEFRILYLPIFYTSDGQLAARGLIYSGPRQVTGLVRFVKVSLSA